MSKSTKAQIRAWKSYREKRSEAGWEYFSCQVPPEWKKKFQALLKKFREQHSKKKD